jgi:hypothetical protein
MKLLQRHWRKLQWVRRARSSKSSRLTVIQFHDAINCTLWHNVDKGSDPF